MNQEAGEDAKLLHGANGLVDREYVIWGRTLKEPGAIGQLLKNAMLPYCTTLCSINVFSRTFPSFVSILEKTKPPSFSAL